MYKPLLEFNTPGAHKCPLHKPRVRLCVSYLTQYTVCRLIQLLDSIL